MRSVVGVASCALLLLLYDALSSSSLFVSSREQQRPVKISSQRHMDEDRPSRKLKRTVRREGDWVITQEIDKNNFNLLDELPEGPTITVTDYHPDFDIRADSMYNGSIYLNAWASDEDYDVAPRYVERYSGIKYGSIFKRFERSQQAYGYTFVNYEISKEDLTKTGKIREVFIDATKFGPSCIQEGIHEKFMSEDCLYLNIWRPSRWKQSLNTTSKCRQKFMGGGRFRKDCEVITNTKTINPDGSIVINTNTNKTSEVLPMGGLYDEDGSLFDKDTDILENKKLDKIREKKGNVRGLQSISDTLDNALDNLDQALNDLNGVIDDDKSDNGGDTSNGLNNTGKDGEPTTLGTYSTDPSGLLPVMVYIHGGDFMEGSGNDPMFDGSKVAGRGQVILITLNYRLGIFGFLPSVGWDQWKVNGGMNGFGDIVEALTWINRNIIQWGGNPDKVTIFGPSSTPAVCLLTMCPLAKGKFQRAILQTSTRETEVRNGRIVTKNGANGASCLLSSQEPYQPLEGRIEVAYKFFDYINETYYNFPENSDPTREDIIDWLKAYTLNSTELLNATVVEGTIFRPNRPAASFDYNRSGTITDTQQRRTFMTWDNDLFPQMPIDLEFANPVDIMVGVRGRATEDRDQPLAGQPILAENDNNDISTFHDEKNPDVLETLSSREESDSDNIFLRNRDDSDRYLQEDLGSGGDNDDDYFDFYATYYDNDLILDEKVNQTICTNYSQLALNEAGRNATKNITVCQDRSFDFSGTTSDQELCVSKQFAEILARNVEGNVYAYVIDDGMDFHGYHRRQLADEKLDQEIIDHWGRSKNNIRPSGFYYDLETLYFFDNYYFGNNFGWRREEVKIRKELFNRWINFAKTGAPVVTKRSAAKARRYATWDPFPKGETGLDTNRLVTNIDSYTPRYLYMSAGFNLGEKGFKLKQSRMIELEDVISHRTIWKYPDKNKKDNDICSWVLDEENDYDGDFVEVLLDFNANTAFEYYVTIPATLNPTINYVPDREYRVKMPPTMAPTSLQNFVEQSLELEVSSSPPPLVEMTPVSTSITFLFGIATVLIAEFIAFG